MSTTNPEPSQNSSDTLFIGLQSYTEAQSGIFYGRGEETDRLSNLVKGNTLTIVFGKSGTGKTSLLNAGVFPRLRASYCLPFRIRLEFADNSPDLITQIKNILKSEIDKYGFKVESYPGIETLWEYFHREQLWKSVTPILIFDQFEEIFTLAKKSNRFGNKELTDFWEVLADLIENSIPENLKGKFLNEKENIEYNYKNQKIKILFSFREEYLPEFENITSKIPSIKYSRFRLMPMNGNQAYEVITKTWKNNIDEVQADKIVGFFSNEADKNKSFDVMEIEPSLLSQVCSHIEKERIAQGRNKISAEFLDKYSKEIILRSIYDEALAESNNAVYTANEGLQKGANPVNEFLEDRLITDEGYRNKYALTEGEANLKPGIEVLKRKYFLRDDGKSVELTHDVLTPIIKNDREKRRKEIAVSAARKKARKRATQIITGALLFSALIAGIIWYFTTKKARQDKAIAEKQTVIIKQNIVKDSIKLDSVKTRINDLSVNKNDSGKIFSLLKQNIQFDSTIKTLNHEVKELNGELANAKNSSDSIKNGLVKNMETLSKLKYDDSINSINDIAQLNNKYALLNTGNASLTNDYNKLKSDLATSKNANTTLQNNYDNLKRDYDLLNRNFNNYKESHAAPANNTPPPPPVDNNMLQIDLYSSKNEKVPDNVTIYLIPDVSANKKIIKDSKGYEKHCDDAAIQKAEGVKTAVFNNNEYLFPDVTPGDYFIKVCSYYGPSKFYTKKSVGIETIRMDISEALK